MTRRDETSTPRWVYMVSFALLCLSTFFRFYRLDNLPGINGDEAEAGVRVDRFIHGQPVSFRTNSGLLFNPFFVVSESIGLKLFGPSFWVLRLPQAIWMLVGLALNFVLYRRAFLSATGALLCTVLLACMPLHLGYSRTGWDWPYNFLTAILILYPMLMIADARASMRDAITLGLGIVLGIWVHPAVGLCVICMGISIVWLRREQWSNAIARRMGVEPGMWIALTAILVLMVAAIGAFLALTKWAGYDARDLMMACLQRARAFAQHPVDTIAYVGQIGDLVSGNRAYLYFAAVPFERTFEWKSILALVLMIFAIVQLWRSSHRSDRVLAMTFTILPLFMIATSAVLSLDLIGHERYFLWIAPASAILLARPRVKYLAPCVLALSAFFLVQFWINYFVPLRDQTYAATLQHAFRTGAIEPKQAAAEMIRKWMPPAGDPGAPRRIVYAQDWWSQHPIQFLLGAEYDVHREQLPDLADTSQAILIVGFAGEGFVIYPQMRLSDLGRPVHFASFPGGEGQPVLVILYAEAMSSATTKP